LFSIDQPNEVFVAMGLCALSIRNVCWWTSTIHTILFGASIKGHLHSSHNLHIIHTHNLLSNLLIFGDSPCSMIRRGLLLHCRGFYQYGWQHHKCSYHSNFLTIRAFQYRVVHSNCCIKWYFCKKTSNLHKYGNFASMFLQRLHIVSVFTNKLQYIIMTLFLHSLFWFIYAESE
jgi:hypothetical protein